jgi:hypothetical protein
LRGNCLPTCPEEAIHLKKKDKEITPYPTIEDIYEGILRKTFN